MKKLLNKYLIILLIISFTTLVAQEIKLPQIAKSSIIKQYEGEEITISAIKKISSVKYSVIIKTEFGKDKVIVDKKGKIYSISEYLEGLDPSGGC